MGREQRSRLEILSDYSLLSPPLAALVLLVAVTIPFTMPTNPLYLVRLVAAELGPYLLIVAAVALALSVVAVRSSSGVARTLYAVVTVEALLALVFAALPLAQLGVAREHHLPAAAADADRHRGIPAAALRLLTGYGPALSCALHGLE